MSWTNEKVEKLKKLWKEGYTTVDIGKILGISKNAVVGKAHRLQLASRPSPIKRSSGTPVKKEKETKATVSAKTSAPVEPKAPPMVKEKEVKKDAPVQPYTGKIVTLMDVTPTSCRWPIGDPKDPDFRFCEHEAVEGKPYCLEHCAQAYVGINKFLKGFKQ